MILRTLLQPCRKHCTTRLYSSGRVTRNAARVLFFGRDEFSCRTLLELHEARDIWDSIDIVTTPDERIGRKRSVLSVSPLKELGQKLGVPVHEVTDGRIIIPPYFDEACSPKAVISASWGTAIPSAVLNQFDFQLNVHPSLLPKYRGAAPIQWTIANGDERTGVSIIKMEDVSKGFDTGDIYAQEAMDVPPNAQYETLAPELAVKGGRLLVTVLRQILNGEVSCWPQDPTQKTLARIIRPHMFSVDWNWDATRLERWHRAVSHQRPLSTSFSQATGSGSKILKLHDISVYERAAVPSLDSPGASTYVPEAEALVIRCGDSTAIQSRKVQPEGRSPMSAKAWWNGIKTNVLHLGR